MARLISDIQSWWSLSLEPNGRNAKANVVDCFLS